MSNNDGIDKQQIRDLLTTIARASRGDYDVRMETSGKHTEFDSIAAGLNMMINEIRSRQEDLEEQRERINALNESLINEIHERAQAENLYKTLTENSTTGIYIVQKGKFVFFNEVFRMNSGYNSEELLGMNSLNLIHPEDREYVRQCAIDMLKGIRTQPYEFRLIDKSGNILWSWEKVTSIMYNDERAALGNFVDITERKNTEEQIRKTNKQLDEQNEKLHIQADRLIQQQQELVEKNREIERANQMKSEFLASMSHELRTPLNAVIGFSELMLDGITGDINDEQQECLNDILNGGQHLLELINDVLDLSKVEVGKMEFKPVELDVSDVINEAVQTVKSLLDQKRHTLNISVEDGISHIYADKSRLRQVLLNLLSNANKFTHQGGKIDITAVKKNGMCLIGVTDNGIGIKKEDQKKIFEVFTQVETIQDEIPKGTGLGLTLTRQFLAAMGGEIWVESEYGKGSTFFVTIPFIKSIDTSSASSEETVGEKAKQRTLNCRKQEYVLIIDDDPVTRRLFSAWLTEEGYSIVEASNADEGIKLADTMIPDIIILDILMPDKDGWYVLKELKSKVNTRNIPVVITSFGEEREMAFSLGAIDYFNKPINKRKFQKRIAEIGLKHHDRVLIIDDNPSDIHLISSMLETEGITSLSAESGHADIDIIFREKPSLIILDLIMPDLSGFEVIEKLHENEEAKDIPIIIITSKDLSNDELCYLNHETKGVVKKGLFNRSDFISTIKKLIKSEVY